MRYYPCGRIHYDILGVVAVRDKSVLARMRCSGLCGEEVMMRILMRLSQSSSQLPHDIIIIILSTPIFKFIAPYFHYRESYTMVSMRLCLCPPKRDETRVCSTLRCSWSLFPVFSGVFHSDRTSFFRCKMRDEVTNSLSGNVYK